MEKLNERLKSLKSALKNFKKSIDRLITIRAATPIDSDELMAYRDSVIKRFEICYDLAWKCLKDFLEKDYGIQVASPKKVFQEFFTQQLLKEEELKEAMQMADDRNQTCHIYNESMADSISEKAASHYELMQKLINAIKIK